MHDRTHDLLIPWGHALHTRKTSSGPINITFHEHNNPKFERNDPLYGCVLIPRPIPIITPQTHPRRAHRPSSRPSCSPCGRNGASGPWRWRRRFDFQTQCSGRNGDITNTSSHLDPKPNWFQWSSIKKTYLRHIICTTKRPTVATCWTTKTNDGTF